MRYVLVALALLASGSAKAEEEQSDDEKKEEAELDAIRADRKAMAAVFGADACWLRTYRATITTRIAKEKKYSAVGGVTNKAVMYNLQQKLMKADDLIEQSRKELRGFKGLVPLPCTSIEVKRVLFCFTTPDECSDKLRYALMAKFLSKVEEDE